jgi:hypothetical protein
MLFSTRNGSIGGLASSEVNFYPRPALGSESEAMLCKHAKSSKDDLCGWSGAVRDDFNFILERCAGLPIALGVAGGSIAVSAGLAGRTPSNAVQEFARRLRSTRDTSLISQGAFERTGPYPSLASVLEASLGCVSQIDTGNLASSVHFKDEMYSALCVMQKQAWTPVSMLMRLWTLPSEDKAGDIVMLLDSLSLADAECRRDVELDRDILGIKLHDLVHDFCVMRAEAQPGGVADWHRRVLNGYAKGLFAEMSKGSLGAEAIERTSWWSEGLVTDGYVHTNLVRHFVGTGSQGVENAAALLLDTGGPSVNST